MPFPHFQDPALSLWTRVDPAELEILKPLVNGNPVPIGAAAEALGLEVVSLTLPADISGLIRQTSNAPDKYAIEVNNTDAPVRQRFTVAHEIAHFLLHRSQIGAEGITDSVLYRSKLSDRTEAEANRLAAALLLPWEAVSDWHSIRFGCSPEAGHIDEIASAFKVSSLAVGFRFGF